MNKDKFINDLMGKMSIEQKVGQLLVLGFSGPIITPDVVDLINKYHIGGLRISNMMRLISLSNDIKPGEEPDESIMRSMHTPKGLNKDYAYIKHSPVATAQEYAGTLNQLRDMSLERENGIPIHYTIDQEGSASDDMLTGQRLFPHPMGIVATGDPKMAYKVALSIGKQVRALGVNMIHSPVVDVNTNPRNPEVGTRAYSDCVAHTIEYSMQSLKGFQDSGLIATAKHFPGRGESEADAHWGLPTVNLDLNDLLENHVAPYKSLIKEGLPAIMMAHSCYPSLGVNSDPAGMSKDLINDFLRGELGFKGVITTDNMMMGGVLKKYEMSEAIVRMVIAGCDLILSRDESPIRYKIVEALVEAVKSGRISEQRLDESVKRILAMRWDMGLFSNGGKVDASRAADPINDPFVVNTAAEAADKSTLLLRDKQDILPLSSDTKVLLVEQIFPTHERANNMYCHPGLLWEEMCKLSGSVSSVEIPNIPSEEDKNRVLRRMEEVDVIVTTNYYYHKAATSISDFVREIMKYGKPVIVVSNTPYEFSAPKDFSTIIVSFNPGGREHLRAVSRIIYGELQATAQLTVKL